MFSSLKKSWASLRRSRPGHRFQASYDRGHKKREQGSTWGKIGGRVLAIGVMAVGVVLLVIPGPGLPLIVGGGALLARDSQRVARTMDWLELKVRALLRPLRRIAQKSSSGR